MGICSPFSFISQYLTSPPLHHTFDPDHGFQPSLRPHWNSPLRTATDLTGSIGMGISGWKEEMALGVPAIDEAHEALFQELARLGHLSDQNFSVAFGELIAAVERDFRGEEDLMEQIAFPSLANHREQHARVLSGLHHAWAAVDEGDLEQGRHALSLLPQWLIFHQATMDLALAAALELVQRQPT
jgi:hemerythrin